MVNFLFTFDFYDIFILIVTNTISFFSMVHSAVFIRVVEIQMAMEVQSLAIILNSPKQTPRHAQHATTRALNGKIFISFLFF